MRNERALAFGQSSGQIYLHDKDSDSVPVDTNPAEAQFSHIPLHRALLFVAYQSLCVVRVFPGTEATRPATCCFNNCQYFPMSRKFQVQTHITLLILYQPDGKKKSKTLPTAFHM